MKISLSTLMIAMVFCLVARFALAQTGGYDLTWSTMDGGGAMNGAGGAFALSGTIGQPDAQVPPVMNGGGYELTGGFWPVAIVCYCPGDMNGDGFRNGRDVQEFVECVIVSGSCACGDVNGLSGIGLDDVAPFVSHLLATTPCP